MTPHLDKWGEIFGPPSDDASMTDEDEPIDRPVASLPLRPDWRELDTGRCVNIFNGALIKPLREKSKIAQVSFYVFTHIVPSGCLLGAAKEAHVLCNFPTEHGNLESRLFTSHANRNPRQRSFDILASRYQKRKWKIIIPSV